MPELPQTRQSLLLRLSQRSNDAWVEFLEIYEQSIHAYAVRRGLQDADARDVTQEVLAAVTNKVSQWQFDSSKGTFRGWLFRVARNMAVDKVLERTKRDAGTGDSTVAKLIGDYPANVEHESTVFWKDYRRKVLHWAAEQVRPSVKGISWQAFCLTAIEGKKTEEVAEQLGVSTGSVYAAKFRIVARLRKLVDQFDDTEQAEEHVLKEFKEKNVWPSN